MKFENINKIPVRTAKIQEVNAITLDDKSVQIEKFEAVKIDAKEVKGLEIKTLDRNNEVLKAALKYGVGTELVREANEDFTNGLLITLEAGTKIEEPIIIDFEMNEKNKTLVDNIVVVAKEDSQVEIIVKYSSDENLEGYHNGVARVLASKNAKVQLTKVNLLGSKIRTFDSNVSDIAETAKVDFIAVELGGDSAISNYEGILTGDRSEGNVYSIYIGTDKETIDMNYIMTIKGKKSIANMDVKGALTDSALKNFKGTLDFKRGATASKGSEEEYCMLLSEKSRSRSVPLLLCEEDDVSGEHAAASGRIDEDKLFYLMTRGISYEEARLLIINAAFNPIIDQIGNEEIRNEILKYVRGRLA
ncbi:MAG: Fe-S cluster assembly protein SufD [Sarcina sp.]